MLVLYAKEITVNVFNLCGNMYHMVAEETINKEITTSDTSSDKNNNKKIIRPIMGLYRNRLRFGV